MAGTPASAAARPVSCTLPHPADRSFLPSINRPGPALWPRLPACASRRCHGFLSLSHLHPRFVLHFLLPLSLPRRPFSASTLHPSQRSQRHPPAQVTKQQAPFSRLEFDYLFLVPSLDSSSSSRVPTPSALSRSRRPSSFASPRSDEFILLRSYRPCSQPWTRRLPSSSNRRQLKGPLETLRRQQDALRLSPQIVLSLQLQGRSCPRTSRFQCCFDRRHTAEGAFRQLGENQSRRRAVEGAGKEGAKGRQEEDHEQVSKGGAPSNLG